ncbi:MAG TPA: hypothetical protein ENK85_11000 [Saprospiraceae bacterium]|nr:hypothetical protein [Saprospiraceae bacterium]
MNKILWFLWASMLSGFSIYAQPATPLGFASKGYDSHIELSWTKSTDPTVTAYRIYRSDANQNDFQLIKSLGYLNDAYIDFVGDQNAHYDYKISAVNQSQQESPLSDLQNASTQPFSDDELLDMVQAYTFRYFWDFAHPVSGMARERNTTSTVTSGGSGFGVMAILVGIERGFITREEGLQRLLKMTNFLLNADRFHGVFPHWMNGATGAVIPFSQYDDGGDLVETAFLLEGLLTAREYFDGSVSEEVDLRQKITQIWEEVDWNWYRKQTQKVLFWHWSPNYGWQLNHEIRGFNEAHIVYILAASSPTHPIPANVYHQGWVTNNYTTNASYYGYPLEVGGFRGGPLFFSHYSYLGFDPRGIRDDYTNYFIRNTRHSLINRAYCIENPKNYEGYSEQSWGLTASDDPFGYLAHEPTGNRDNGTITPTAALSSFPYTPEASMPALKYFYRELGDKIWGKYGFTDAFNVHENWYATSYLAIDQGPIIGMIENYRTGLLWQYFMKNPEIQTGLDKLGFVPDSTVSIFNIKPLDVDVVLFPNPVADHLQLNIQLDTSLSLSGKMTNGSGKTIQQIFTNRDFVPGTHHLEIDLTGIPTGSYFLTIYSKDQMKTTHFLID